MNSARSPEPIYSTRLPNLWLDQNRPTSKYIKHRISNTFKTVITNKIKAHCLIDSGYKGIMISFEFTRVAKIKTFALEKPIRIQLAVMGSKSIINYGTNTTININGSESKEYLNVVNIGYYNAILGTLTSA